MTYKRPKQLHELSFDEIKDRANHWTADEDTLRKYVRLLEDKLAAAENRIIALNARVGTLNRLLKQRRSSP